MRPDWSFETGWPFSANRSIQLSEQEARLFTPYVRSAVAMSVLYAVVGSSSVSITSAPPVKPSRNPHELPDRVDKILETHGAWRKLAKDFELASQRDTAGMVGIDKSKRDAQCEAQTEIAPILGSRLVSHAAVQKHQQGVVVARIRNLSNNCTTSKYLIPPGATVWWVVEKGENNGPFRSRFVNEGKAGGEDESDVAGATAKRWHWTECKSHEASAVDFARITYVADNCGYRLASPETKPGAVRARRAALKKKMFDAGDLTFWFTCSNTCCYADEI
jgi:hypothetical protein